MRKSILSIAVAVAAGFFPLTGVAEGELQACLVSPTGCSGDEYAQYINATDITSLTAAELAALLALLDSLAANGALINVSPAQLENIVAAAVANRISIDSSVVAIAVRNNVPLDQIVASVGGPVRQPPVVEPPPVPEPEPPTPASPT